MLCIAKLDSEGVQAADVLSEIIRQSTALSVDSEQLSQQLSESEEQELGRQLSESDLEEIRKIGQIFQQKHATGQHVDDCRERSQATRQWAKDQGRRGKGAAVDKTVAAGNDKAAGVAGNDGAAGVAGNDGAAGAAGNDRAAGAAGDGGAAGVAGNDRAAGVAGDGGAAGVAGDGGDVLDLNDFSLDFLDNNDVAEAGAGAEAEPKGAAAGAGAGAEAEPKGGAEAGAEAGGKGGASTAQNKKRSRFGTATEIKKQVSDKSDQEATKTCPVCAIVLEFPGFPPHDDHCKEHQVCPACWGAVEHDETLRKFCGLNGTCAVDNQRHQNQANRLLEEARQIASKTCPLCATVLESGGFPPHNVQCKEHLVCSDCWFKVTSDDQTLRNYCGLNGHCAVQFPQHCGLPLSGDSISSKIICQSCAEPPMIGYGCEHSLCVNCCKNSMLRQIESKTFPAECLFCGLRISNNKIEAVLDEKELRKYNQLQLVNSVSDDQTETSVGAGPGDNRKDSVKAYNAMKDLEMLSLGAKALQALGVDKDVTSKIVTVIMNPVGGNSGGGNINPQKRKAPDGAEQKTDVRGSGGAAGGDGAAGRDRAGGAAAVAAGGAAGIAAGAAAGGAAGIAAGAAAGGPGNKQVRGLRFKRRVPVVEQHVEPTHSPIDAICLWLSRAKPTPFDQWLPGIVRLSFSFDYFISNGFTPSAGNTYYALVTDISTVGYYKSDSRFYLHSDFYLRAFTWFEGEWQLHSSVYNEAAASNPEASKVNYNYEMSCVLAQKVLDDSMALSVTHHTFCKKNLPLSCYLQCDPPLFVPANGKPDRVCKGKLYCEFPGFSGWLPVCLRKEQFLSLNELEACCYTKLGGFWFLKSCIIDKSFPESVWYDQQRDQRRLCECKKLIGKPQNSKIGRCSYADLIRRCVPDTSSLSELEMVRLLKRFPASAQDILKSYLLGNSCNEDTVYVAKAFGKSPPFGNGYYLCCIRSHSLYVQACQLVPQLASWYRSGENLGFPEGFWIDGLSFDSTPSNVIFSLYTQGIGFDVGLAGVEEGPT